MDLPIGLPLADKIKLLRKHENLSQRAFGELVGVPQTTLANIEKGRNKTIGVDVLSKIANHPRFFPYAMWLLVDELTEDQAQQITDYLRSVQEPD